MTAFRLSFWRREVGALAEARDRASAEAWGRNVLEWAARGFPRMESRRARLQVAQCGLGTWLLPPLRSERLALHPWSARSLALVGFHRWRCSHAMRWLASKCWQLVQHLALALKCWGQV